MAKITLTKDVSANIQTPDANKVSIFIDADGDIKMKDASGNVHIIKKDYSDPSQKEFIAGEEITQDDINNNKNAVYLASDNKVYKTSANNIGRLQCIGFVVYPVLSGGIAKVSLGVINEGFTGLTIGANYFLSNTSGAISTTPGTYTVDIGKAISATQILMKFGIGTFGGDVLVLNNPTLFFCTGGTTYTKYVEYTVNKSGLYTIKFTLSAQSGNVAYGRIYKNGVAVGTECSVTNPTVTEFSETISFVRGDKLQIYGKGNDADTFYIQYVKASVLLLSDYLSQ